MEKGVVKWFNNSKGYGFLLAEDGVSDIFVHYSSISMEGYRTLKTGQEVMYEFTDGPKGKHATRIDVLDNTQESAENFENIEEVHSAALASA